jgi:NADPH-dependent glutamate synthase beta subunit-like oxidoreductase
MALALPKPLDKTAIIKLGTHVGKDTSIATLFEEGNRAIFLAPGKPPGGASS